MLNHKGTKTIETDRLILRPFTMDDAPAMYRELGFDAVTSFGCFLGQDYAELYGDTPLAVYDEILFG